MDQSDLAFVRATLDAVVAGNVNVEDAVSALEMLDYDVEQHAPVSVPETGTDVVPYEAHENEGDDDGDALPF